MAVPKRKMDMEECKMFVGGLTRDTTADMLRDYFTYYGRVTHAVVMTNPDTQKSRGFGFVAFDRPEVVDRVVMSGPHFLDGKQIDPKPSVPKDLRPKPPAVEQPKKAFLGGLPLEMNEADLREYFSRYGVVTECYIMFDEKRMKSRGFGFVSFEDESVVNELVNQHYIDVRDKRVEVKLARPRENPLAPLNSEGRVLSVDAQQQRVAAAAAAAAVASSRRRPPPVSPDPYYDYGYHAPPDRYDPYYDSGPPAPKRFRPHTPPYPRTPPPPAAYYDERQYHRPYAEYDEPGYSRRDPPVSSKRSMSPMRSSTSATSHGRAYPALASSGYGGSGAIDANTTPESMTSLMQQAMKNMGGSTGGVNSMMMPMFMSNMMTQMFMNQAQTMFQSMMQQRKSESGAGTSKGDGSSNSMNSGDMMDVMKNVLQTLMATMMQQQDQSQSKPDSDGK